MLTYVPPGQPGWHHVNCQPAEYWIEKMRAIEFRFDAELARLSTACVEPGHYRDKGLFFVRETG
jgi:hypothetical protein